MTLGEQSLNLHKDKKGKLEVKSKVSLSSREDLSLAYTPGVAAVSEAIGKDASLAKIYTMKQNAVAVVSDGSAILGLGNLGPLAALPVMEGKAILFKEFGGIDAFPLCLDTQDTEEIIATVKRIAPVFGGINLEDIAAPRCFEVEKRLRAELNIPVMHDDQHGTAVVVLAALINTLKLKKQTAKEARVVINGAGAAGQAVARLLLTHGFIDLIMCDSKGIINLDRDDLDPYKQELSGLTNPRKLSGNLGNAIKEADIFIGVSKPGVLSKEMIQSMRKDPAILALANPVPEIEPQDAKEAGAYIIATGRSDYPNQINNVLAFPGIFRGALDNNIEQFTPEMFSRAAQALADYQKNITPESLLPAALDKGVAAVIAQAIK